MKAFDHVKLARDNNRPHTRDYIDHLFTDFIAFAGDRCGGEDESIIGGIASYHGIPVTVIGQQKGSNLKDNLRYNFGMPSPEGYRKVQRLASQAEKFGRPIITLIDTPGAYPGVEAEEHGQGEAIAECIAQFSGLSVPVIAVIIGEGGSGGALALGVANYVIMLENAIYSILSPEGFASILWKDAERHEEAAEVMKLTSDFLVEAGVADEVVKEPYGGAQNNPAEVFLELDKALAPQVIRLNSLSAQELIDTRRERFERFALRA